MTEILRNRARVVIALLASCVLADAMAQFPATAGGGAAAAMTHYPWDRRAELCKPPSVPRGDECNPDDWPNWSTTSQRVEMLYTIEQFVLLERALGELAASQRFYPGGDTPASAVYWAFRRQMPAPGAAPDHQRKIAAWNAAVPASSFVALAQARYLYASAWNVRGTGGATSVSKESWELFAARLQEAVGVLERAPAALKANPLWHNLRLAIALDHPVDKVGADAVFQEAVKRWPRYFDFYELRLTRMTPRWGGNWDEVESFIGRWSSQLSSSEGASVYARLHVSLRSQGVTPEQTKMDWPKMKASFEDLTTRYPSADYRNLYASYACAARDKEAFSAAMAKLAPQQLDPRNWLRGHSHEACKLWAGV